MDALPIATCLPFEICDTIVKLLLTTGESGTATPKYLYTALLISRIWRAAAELCLYTAVDVPPQRLLPFARTMLARPDLAERITKLCCSVVGRGPSLPEDRAVVAEMFGNLEHLTDLHLYSAPFEAKSKLLISPTDAEVLIDAPFYLTRLICTFDWTEELVAVLREQTELREFALSGSASTRIPFWYARSVFDQFFMHCTRMTLVPNVLESLFFVPPALTNVRFRIDDYSRSDTEATRDAMKELRRLEETLRVLYIERKAIPALEFYPPAKLVKCFARELSDLVFLGLEDEVDYSPRDHRQVRNVICGHLTNLRVIVWAPSRPFPRESVT